MICCRLLVVRWYREYGSLAHQPKLDYHDSLRECVQPKEAVSSSSLFFEHAYHFDYKVIGENYVGSSVWPLSLLGEGFNRLRYCRSLLRNRILAICPFWPTRCVCADWRLWYPCIFQQRLWSNFVLRQKCIVKYRILFQKLPGAQFSSPPL